MFQVAFYKGLVQTIKATWNICLPKNNPPNYYL